MKRKEDQDLHDRLNALESSHAIAYAAKHTKDLGPDACVIVNLSGRGDKDTHTVADALGVTL